MPSNTRTALVVAVTLMLVTSAGVAGAAFGTATSADMDESSVEAADEIFVFENGDAILVYRGEHEESTASGHAALDVTNGLAAIFLTDSIDPEASGQGTVVLTPDMVDANGALAIPTPESIEDLTFDVSTSTNETASTGSLSVDATFKQAAETTDDTSETTETAPETMNEVPESLTEDVSTTSPDEIVATEGVITIGSSLTSQGYVFVGSLPESTADETNTADAEVSAESDTAAESDSTAKTVEGEFFQISLTEEDDSFVLTGYQSTVVDEFTADSWKTSEAAEQTLLDTFSTIAENLEGEATVTVDEHEFDAETGRLTVSYTVTFDGIQAALSEKLADAMAAKQDIELTEEQRAQIAERISAVKLTDMTVLFEKTDTATAFAWNVQLDELDELMTANIEIAALAGEDDALIETARAKLEAKQAADLTMTVDWGALVSNAEADEQMTRLQLVMNVDHENWESFVSELDTRGIDVGTSSVEIHAGTEDGVLSTDVAVTVSQSDLVDMAMQQLLEQSADSADDGMDPHTAKIVEALEQGEFEKAKLDVNMQEGTVTIQAAAKFANLEALGELIDEEFDGLHVEQLYTRADAGETTTYVKVSGATMANPTIDEVQQLTEVGAETVVHMPTEWDPETTTFPEMDATEIGAYLELSEEEEQAEEEPVAGEEPIAEEEPVAGEEPIAEEEPVAGEEPIAEEEPVAGEEPIAEEEPVAGEEKPMADDEPIAGEEKEPEPIAAGVSGLGVVALLGAALLARRHRF
ncbi:hypothetical protein [Haloarchaeobius sp. DT45]|uniref:hypothetical protein n=1 Tax=Haloarchaeobius sp. DT45 TaxID=3446116 RepID=UPI003F6AF9D1